LRNGIELDAVNQTTQETKKLDSTSIAARAESASKIYGSGESEVRALDNVSVSFERSKFSAIMGPSGSGKSTLMHCIAGLDALTSGSVYIGETDLSKLSDKEITKLRREKVGFIFQSFNLIPTLNAYENITLPLSLGKSKGDKAWIQQVIDTISTIDLITAPANSLAASNNELQSRAHSRLVLKLFLLMSRQAILTQSQVATSSNSCVVQ
jgi:putative ABC transport system ATP-binding protein